MGRGVITHTKKGGECSDSSRVCADRCVEGDNIAGKRQWECGEAVLVWRGSASVEGEGVAGEG